jgi:hypothetical protein
MAVATVTLTANGYPNGNDNTQRRQRLFGGGVGVQAGPNSLPLVVNGATFVGSSPSYVQGGIRINFGSLEAIKTGPPNLLPQWCELKSLSGSGYIYQHDPLGPQITNLALTSNVITITAKNNLAAGDVVVLSGLTVNTALNGISLTVLVGSLTATAFTANFTAGNISSAAELGYCTPILYASGKPFQGNLQIFQSAATVTPPNPLAEISTAALPTAIVGSASVNADVLGWTAEFVRAN